MKVLICSNGPWPAGDHRMDWTVGELQRVGFVQEYKIFSHGGFDPEKRKQFLERVEAEMAGFNPDVVIWHKDSGSDLPETLIQKVSRQSCLIYHDLDPWSRWLNPIGRNQQLFAKHARRTCLCGLGEIADQFGIAGDRIRYVPHGYYDLDIPAVPSKRSRKLVFIGSSIRKGRPFLGNLAPELHPGRANAVRTLRKRLGTRFIVHGMGYPRSWWIEPTEFDRQFVLMNENIASFAIDQVPRAAGYFSNRTPFALALGSIHFKMYRPSDDAQFRGCPGCISVKTADEAAEAFEVFAALSKDSLDAIAEETRVFARARFRTPDLMRAMVEEALS